MLDFLKFAQHVTAIAPDVDASLLQAGNAALEDEVAWMEVRRHTWASASNTTGVAVQAVPGCI